MPTSFPVDLDVDEMGGVVTWTEPSDTSLVEVYRHLGPSRLGGDGYMMDGN